MTFEDIIGEGPVHPIQHGPVTDPVLLKQLEEAVADPPFPVSPVADFSVALFFLGLAVALYAGSRALGWIVVGFMPSSA